MKFIHPPVEEQHNQNHKFNLSVGKEFIMEPNTSLKHVLHKYICEIKYLISITFYF